MRNFQYLKFSLDLEQNLIQTKSRQIFNNEKNIIRVINM